MLILVLIIVSIGLGSCGIFNHNLNKFKPLNNRNISNVEIETLWEDSVLSVRALQLEKDGLFYFSGNNSSIGFSYFNGYDWHREVKVFKYDSLVNKGLEFRSISMTKDNLFFVAVSDPALVYKHSKRNIYNVNELILPKLVYQEDHKKTFYDSMDFWNHQEGIAIGDPTDDCMSIIITRDGGNTWTKLSCDDLPRAKEGEAAFAASDTNIAIVGDHTWVATGGKASRILYSPNKGKTWEIYDTPIVQGKETTGIYSLAFYDENNGFAIGGDYTKPNDTLNNKIRTIDGGKTWQVVANGKGPGYRSCVQYIPNSKGKELVAVGFKGIDYSNNSGDSWKHLSDEGFYTIRFVNDSVAYAAGKGRISKLTFRE